MSAVKISRSYRAENFEMDNANAQRELGRIYFETGAFVKSLNRLESAIHLYKDLGREDLVEDCERILTLVSYKMETEVETKNHTYDLVFNRAKNQIWERQRGHLDLKHQFVLRDILNVMLMNPGREFSKEEVTMLIWPRGIQPNCA